MFGSKIKVTKELYEKLQTVSTKLGCSSVEEFASRVLELEADRILQESSQANLSKEEVDNIAKQLQGLGYLE